MSTNQALAVSHIVTKYSETEKAQMFMADLRLAQVNKGKLLSGRNNLSNAQHAAIKHAVSSINVSRNFNDNSAPAAFKALLERFEEMGRRNGLPIHDTLRPAIASLLLEELALNAIAFNCEKAVKKMVPLTLFHGDSCIDMPDRPEFKSLRDMQWIFKYAVMHYPTNPYKFLCGVIDAIAALKKNPEFDSLRTSPGIFTHAAINFPKDPYTFLHGVIKNIADLKQNPEFESLRDSPNIFKHAAIHYHSDPHEFLRRVIRKVETLKIDPEFSPLHSAPWKIKQAATYYPENTRQFLRRYMAREAKLGGEYYAPVKPAQAVEFALY